MNLKEFIYLLSYISQANSSQSSKREAVEDIRTNPAEESINQSEHGSSEKGAVFTGYTSVLRAWAEPTGFTT